jgi:hypothetical protein
MPRHRSSAWAAVVATVVWSAVVGTMSALAASRPAISDATLDDWDFAPARHRAALVQIARAQAPTLAVDRVLALGDALLRTGEPGIAGRLFRNVLARDVGPVPHAWARYGLGWILLAEGRFGAAVKQYRAIVAGGSNWSTASIVLAMLGAGSDARMEDTVARAVAAENGWPAQRLVGTLGMAYARYWSGDPAAAVAIFERAAAMDTTSLLVDDARYGAAWSRYRAGDREGALRALRQLAPDRPVPLGRRINRGLVKLDRRAVFRESLRRYRGPPPQTPDQRLITLIDLDGLVLANEAVRWIEAEAGRPPERGDEITEARRPPATPATIPVASSPGAAAPGVVETHRMSAVGTVLGGVLVALLALLASMRLMARRRARPPRRRRLP